MGEQIKKRIRPQYEGKKRSERFYFGRTGSNELKAKLSEINTGKKLSDETKKKLSDVTPKFDHQEGAIRRVYRMYRSNSHKRGLSFDLTLDQFREIVSKSCSYCGGEPKKRVVGGQKGRHSRIGVMNGIDRVVNHVGYEIDNCVACCQRCNEWKHTSSRSEFIEHIKKIYKNWSNRSDDNN